MSHAPAVYGSLTCLNAAAGTEITQAYVTHCEDYRDLANGRTTGIYSFRDLYTVALASVKDGICRFPSVLALNDLRVRPVRFARGTPRYDVSVLFQGDKEYCPHYAQAV